MYGLILLAGFFGGVIRGLMGFIKHKFSYKNVSFDLKNFILTIFISGVIGITTASAVKETVSSAALFTPAISLIVGYAGGDFLENVYKIIAKKSYMLEKND